MPKCVICEKKLVGHGNNAEPVKKGVCYDYCNGAVVIPVRLGKITAGVGDG